MKRNSNMQRNVKRALERGYYVLDNGNVIGIRGYILKPYSNKFDGRLRISVVPYPGCKPRSVMVHQIAALQRFGETAFLSSAEIRHLDGNLKNNSKTNIALGTSSENQMDIPVETRTARARKAARTLRSLSSARVKKLRADRARGMKYVDLMVKYRLAKGTVSYIIRGITYNDEPGVVSLRSKIRSTKHGRAAMYTRHGCRCDKCKAWKSKSAKKYRKRSMAKTVDAPA